VPSRNEIKEDVPGGIYHIYNRGVERRKVFMDGRDYLRFLAQLRQCLDREPSITILAYCLMPNHFHLLLKQSESQAVGHFMQRLSIAYTMYFNIKRRRVGPLFQGKYKAVRIIGTAIPKKPVSTGVSTLTRVASTTWTRHKTMAL
jgi:REP element-mobilizing transposase RayT